MNLIIGLGVALIIYFALEILGTFNWIEHKMENGMDWVLKEIFK
jgi:hypothetical protein